MKLLGLVIIVLLSAHCDNQSHKKAVKKVPAIAIPLQKKSVRKIPKKVSTNEQISTFRFETIYDPQLGWGYDIYQQDVLKIHQPHIPVIQGLKGFENANDAALVAKKVLEKLDAGMMPPTLTEQELIQLGVIH
jgi:hypothetical protein